MSVARTIPPAVLQAQLSAADPEVSAFVSANAGSGKTHVLAQRVINLLLRGVDPAKILCITFTKAAAANMAKRVFNTLAKWTELADNDLDDEIRLGGRTPDATHRARARRLFASALETPGGLKVQTIHAFCTRLLHQFPFEANVGARFAVLDEATTRQLLDQLTLDVLLQAAARTDSALGKALATAIVAAADTTFREVIGEAIAQRDALTAWIERAGSVEAAIAELSRSFGVDPADTLESLEDEFFSASLVPEAEWPLLIEVLETGSVSDKKHIKALQDARAASGRERIDEYLKIFCTAELTPRKNLLTKKIADRHPEWLERLQAEQTRVCALLARERALRARERTAALITIAKEVIDRYRCEKERRALLDYEDLIDKTLPLLSDGAASWVHYKLDLGIDHILIDEAQDTSPKQWEIICLLASEFMPGGARENVRRTMFAVGDEKQSIFSFQGAAPKAFDERRRFFERQLTAAGLGFRHVRLHHSFRSGVNVLGSVDRVFAARDIYESITTDAVGMSEHQSLPDAAPGLVELWPLIEPPDKREIEGWDAPFDKESEVSPRVTLANRIAGYVQRACARGRRPGEVLILVRQRGPLFEAIIRALKKANVPVAGADRLLLGDHIAVMDLMALADCLLLSDDDLALASVLKSPLFGITEEQLFELAWNREAALRESLRRKAEDALFGAIDAELDDLAEAAHQMTPFGFFAHVLGAKARRRKFLARLGPEANDALDEFLNLALDYETRETPSLQGFLAFMRAAKSEVKRDMEMARDEVRVMTVHGAKGLEANTVILADTTTNPKGGHPPKLLDLENGALAWAQSKQDDTEVMTQARAGEEIAARDEYRRLLYVAMTRAAERLIVCGSKGDKMIPDGCWYQLVEEALRDECVAEPADDGEGEVLRYRKQPEAPAAIAPSETRPVEIPVLPAWLTRAAPAVVAAERSVTPSSAAEDVPHPAPSPGARVALLRGSLVHRLLQSLPDIPPAQRRAAMDDYLRRMGTELPSELRDEIAEQVMRVLEDGRFYALYQPGSRAEVPIVGRLATNTGPISRQRPGRPPGRHASFCFDCRFQDQPGAPAQRH